MEDGVGAVIKGQQGALPWGESRPVDCGGPGYRSLRTWQNCTEQATGMRVHTNERLWNRWNLDEFCVYTQRSVCETGEIWMHSLDRTNINLLVLLSKMFALEETG